MKTPSKILLGIVFSVAASCAVAIVAFAILRGMNAEVRRMEALREISDKTRALQILIASFKGAPAEGDHSQVNAVLLSMAGELKKIPSRSLREKGLIEQLQKGYDELGPMIHMWLVSGHSAAEMERERQDMLASQIGMKAQFISDDTRRLKNISQSRILAVQQNTVIVVVVLIVLLAVTNGIIYFVSVQSIVRAHRRLLAESAELAKLNEMSSRLWQTPNLAKGMDQILHSTIELLRADMGNIQIYDNARGVLTIAVHHGFKKDFLEFFREVDSKDDSACGRALRSGKRTVISDVETNAEFAPLREIARSAGYRSVQSTPLRVNGQPLGMISTHWVRPYRPSKDDLRRLDLYAAYAAAFIERARAEQERARLLESEQKARAEAEHAGRIKDEFLATLSHELRNPLNAILGWVRLIDKNPGDSESVKEGIQVISRNAKLQADLIADLLDMSRIVSGKIRLQIEEISLSDVITAAVDSVRHSAEAKGIRIEPIASEISDVIRGDSGRLQQVVWNLLSNAIKFTPKGGRIQVVLTKKDSHAEISVSDTGIGIRPDFLPHVFERFRQADASTTRAYGGLGLGLSIVKSLVEMHGGTVEAFSSGEGNGATFRVRIPVALMHVPHDKHSDQEARPDAPPSEICNSVDLTGVKILAIDDQVDARDLLKRVLEECHAHVITSGSVDEALLALKEYRPHIVLCDIGLPNKDGYEFIKAIREQGDQTPALAVTAFARSEDRLRALRSGYQGHISKPIEPSELVATVGVFVKEHIAVRCEEIKGPRNEFSEKASNPNGR